ncbi:DNA/RNA non-specific endonuclease [Listeria booriae]|uniref:DNA/RNA non-specific endonuclease n=1 Tax=Listeria booriae TaxID=1552123 RepID=UPI0028801729|nr:DNA/RNA non-specific endonuclease [Listeria booriae]MDT0112401.1 DNA/RNA non-specific endonuclease [Listeria booriae]
MKKKIITVCIIILSVTIAYNKGFLIPSIDEKSEPSIYTDQQSELASLANDSEHQVVIVNGNKPDFTEEDLSLAKGSWQIFSNLDDLNRVGVANAMLGKELMPTKDREPLYVNPTGWKNKKLATGWLYNRCHLVGYQLTGENNNLKNLMTGTRSFNTPGMLRYENKVASYIRTTKNHVRYQAKPIFKGSELVARGVQIQAKSIEDDLISFNVYVFNVEEAVTINYQDGSSKIIR